MGNLHPDVKVFLIGGSSHVGKSTLAESLAATLGWSHVSTDSLARHPGRPWRPAPEEIPNQVARHYLCLSVDKLIEDVLRHHRVNVWPKVEAIITSHSDLTSTTGVILEGSALWPEFVAGLNLDTVVAVWLTADAQVFRQRIHDGSLYGSKSARERKMIDKFLERTLAYDARMVDAVNQHGFMLLDVSQAEVSGPSCDGDDLRTRIRQFLPLPVAKLFLDRQARFGQERCQRVGVKKPQRAMTLQRSDPTWTSEGGSERDTVPGNG